jgi:signal transduction histidine kinase
MTDDDKHDERRASSTPEGSAQANEHHLGGAIAVEVARELVEPVRALRDRLGLVVDTLERHVATSTGPTPYPWRSVQSLRHDLAATYLEATTLARRLDELDRALDHDPPSGFDPSAAVDLGLRLATHHLTPSIELVVDLGSTPLVRGTPGTLALVIAQLVSACAESAREAPGSSLSVRVVLDGDIDDGASIAVTIADNGAGSSRAQALGELARSIVEPWGATVDAASEAGQGTSFELRLAVHTS